MTTTRTENGHKYNTKTSTKISTKRTKEHRTTEEEMEVPNSSWELRNRKRAKPFMNMMMMMMMMMMKMMIMGNLHENLQEHVCKLTVISREIFSQNEKVFRIVIQKIKTHILRSITLLRKPCRLWDKVERMTRDQTGHRQRYNTAYAFCMLDN